MASVALFLYLRGMGMLSISHELQDTQPDIVDMMFRWIKLEHRACILWQGRNSLKDYIFRIEGDEIPEGCKNFTLTATEIVDGVIAFNIT